MTASPGHAMGQGHTSATHQGWGVLIAQVLLVAKAI
jgi:hypothetical protein